MKGREFGEIHSQLWEEVYEWWTRSQYEKCETKVKITMEVDG